MGAHSENSGGKRKMSRRTLYIISSAVTVLVLAGVIFGVSALSDPAESQDTRVELSPGEQSMQLYEQALAALDAGDDDAAQELLQKAITMDPTNSDARNELTSIVESKLPGDSGDDPDPSAGEGDSGGDTPDSPADPNEGFLDAVDDLATLLPATAAGYDLGLNTVVGTDANVAGDPTDDGPKDVVTRALFSVHDFETVEKAQGFVTNVTKSAFPQNGADVTIDGVAGYFGTDGVRFATVAYSRGRFAFEVIITTDSVAPGALLDVAVDAATAFPDSL